MITVYYAVDPLDTFKLGNEPFQENLNEIMIESLVSVYLDLKQNENKNNTDTIFVCKSFLQYTKNMYLMKNPYDMNIRVEKTRVLNLGNRDLDNLYFNRVLQTDGVYNLNYDQGYIFFCESSLEIEVLSPFMHKSSFCKNGYIVPGSFDISKWFRPLNPALQFYDNSDKIIQSPVNDPLMYIKFQTTEGVKLQKFIMTPELEDIVSFATKYKVHDPNRSLSYLYDKFTKAGLHKKTLKLIKENLI